MTDRILVRAPNWLGDAVMCGPFLKRLLARNPGSPVDVACRSSLAGVFQGFPGLGQILKLEPGEGLWAAARRLREREYRQAYALPPSFSSALLFFLSGIPDRIGGASDFRSLLLTRAVPIDERFHYVRRYLSLIGEAGRDAEAADFYFPVAPEAELDEFLAGHAVPRDRPLLAVAPGSRAPARRWFPERFAQVADGAARRSTVLLLGAPEDTPHAADVERLCRGPVTNLCGKTSLPLLGGVLKRCAALVTNESGLMHAGWAVGTPLVVVAGPSEPQATSPFGPRVRVIQRREVPCVPCVRNECYRSGDEYKMCLKKIGAEDVSGVLKAVLREGTA